MSTIQRSALVPHSAQQMYQLVNDIEAYPEFLPWCSGAQILEDGDAVRVARVDISKGPLVQHFTTRNELQEGQSIQLALVEGPFRQLQGQWEFSAIGDQGCRVSFEIEFSFKSALIEKTLGPVFNEICTRLVDAFVTRARQLYTNNN